MKKCDCTMKLIDNAVVKISLFVLNFFVFND